jgi:hypothetical protein
LIVVPEIQPAVAAPAGSLGSSLASSSVRAALLVTAPLLALAGIIIALPWLRQHIEAQTVIASVAVVAGMWLERWNIVVPTLTHQRLIPWTTYTPTLTEWSLTAASFALFVLLLLLFFKLVPCVSLWEVEEGRVVDRAQARLEIPLPPESSQSEALT